ncbi:Polyketide synthase 1 [Frankliniella fusca]|uniref:Polyketide synthase 1 n=1 Tax=Frankliniella fusca TaxID=407009 RepID=A0AAE1LF10_9NEOP|nr:Polyketide synthase 1 [Frankliniella fusca]
MGGMDYPDLIDWKRVKVTFPPVPRRFTNNDLEQAVENPDFVEENLPPFPCHTQAVERTVQLVSKASKNVSGQDGRDGFIRNTIQSRQSMPKFRTKSEYNCVN